MVLPEINKRPVKPQLETLVVVSLDVLHRPGLVALRVEYLGLHSPEARVLAQPCHARHKLVRTDARVQDGVQRRARNLSGLAVELVAHAQQERTQALHERVDAGRLRDRSDELCVSTL